MVHFSYNTSVHEGTQFTPHELVYGKLARTAINDNNVACEQNESYANYLENLYSKISRAQSTRQSNQSQAQIKILLRKEINGTQATELLRIGDEVYLLKEPVRNKLSDQYMKSFNY
ncbi:hypothetical protein P5V15_014677 [Pogonomyrmex californicus]